MILRVSSYRNDFMIQKGFLTAFQVKILPKATSIRAIQQGNLTIQVEQVKDYHVVPCRLTSHRPLLWVEVSEQTCCQFLLRSSFSVPHTGLFHSLLKKSKFFCLMLQLCSNDNKNLHTSMSCWCSTDGKRLIVQLWNFNKYWFYSCHEGRGLWILSNQHEHRLMEGNIGFHLPLS